MLLILIMYKISDYDMIVKNSFDEAIFVIGKIKLKMHSCFCHRPP